MWTEQKDQGAFGPGTQTFLVLAGEFIPLSTTDPPLTYLGFHYYHSPGSATPVRYAAPVLLPAGAVVGGLQCYVRDSSATNNILFELKSYSHDVATNVSQAGIILTSWSTSLAAGYLQPSSPDLNYTIRYDDGAHRYVYYLTADLASDTALRDCRIFWKRSVSPAPAAVIFGDVPEDYIYFRAIEALAAAGITAGCPGGNFCPGQNLTRGEFATFLARALGLHWPD